MDKKVTDVIAYISWIGWIVAFCAGDKENCKFHLNQALVINIAMLVAMIPIIGWLWGVFVFVCWIIALIAAANGEEKKVPLLGNITLIK